MPSESDNCPRCKHSMDHHVSFNTGRAIRCNYDTLSLFQPCRCDEFVGKPKPRRTARYHTHMGMTKPTDAMRAECERALDAWTQGYDLPLPGHGPSIAPGKCQRCDGFRAGFYVLAAEVAALRAGREEDARLRLFALRATAQAVLTGAAVEAARRAGKKRKRKQKKARTA